MPINNETLCTRLWARLTAIRERIAQACHRAGRNPAEVSLVAVTKTVSADVASMLPQIGVFDLGESRPQELWHKASQIHTSVRWHLIGHLQRNKVSRTLPLVSRIHSVDSLRLLSAIEQEASPAGVDVMLEVNASGEEQKHGIEPDDMLQVLDHLPELHRVRVTGLMTMAALEENPERCRPTFARLWQLREQFAGKVTPPHHLGDLSMGMTNDYEVAIEEGSTIVRIGSALFAELEDQ
jgi:pyridoxal phosphate enzyme (YggS family)